MAGAVNRKTWIRVSGTRTGGGEISLSGVPIRGWIRRARAAGTGNLTLSIGEASSPGTFGVVLAYSATATPIDQEEDPGVFYAVDPTSTPGSTGTIFADVTTTSAGTAINVQLDIEPANSGTLWLPLAVLIIGTRLKNVCGRERVEQSRILLMQKLFKSNAEKKKLSRLTKRERPGG